MFFNFFNSSAYYCLCILDYSNFQKFEINKDFPDKILNILYYFENQLFIAVIMRKINESS